MIKEIINPRIGINIPAGIHSIEQLNRELASISNSGFTCAELRLDSFPLIIGGEICRLWAEKLSEVLSAFPLTYSTHIGRGMDLREERNSILHRKVFFSSIEVSRILGSSTLILHYEEESRDNKKEMLFLESIREGAIYAAEQGITLCMENIEVERVKPVIDFIGNLNHPNLKMNFDTGHAFIASHYFHFDFLESLKEALPILGHVHLNDNTGDFEELRISNRTAYDVLPPGYRFEFGRGDIHLPPFWGRIPFTEVFSLLKDYSNMFICEYYSERFSPFASDIYRKVLDEVIKNR